MSTKDKQLTPQELNEIKLLYLKLGVRQKTLGTWYNVPTYKMTYLSKGYKHIKRTNLFNTTLDIDTLEKQVNLDRKLIEKALHNFKHRYSISYDELYDLRINQKLTMPEISKIKHMSVPTIQSILQSYNIVTNLEFTSTKVLADITNLGTKHEEVKETLLKSPSLEVCCKKFNVTKYTLRKYIEQCADLKPIYEKIHTTNLLDRDYICDCYLTNSKTTLELAKEYHVSRATIYYKLRGWLGEDYKSIHTPKIKIQKDLLQELYIERKLSMRDISRLTGHTTSCVRNNLDYFGFLPYVKNGKCFEAINK